MRLVILFNPKVPVEHITKGRDYAEASFGTDYYGEIADNKALAAHLREIANALEAPTLEDREFTLWLPH